MDEELKEPLTEEAPTEAEFKNKYFRTLAEMENLRKRLHQEKQETIAYAIDNMLTEFLAPLDSFESALAYADNLSPELKNWAQGFKMIANQFKEVLENHGIRPYESVGKRFDPHLHDGVETMETTDHDEDTVIAEVVKGYRRGDRILRVAKVKVAKRQAKISCEGENHVQEEK